MKVNREELLKLHNQLTEAARSVMQKKNQDYATDTDVFRNFRMFGGLGILVRLSDKLARLRSFEEKGTFAVEDEKLADTIHDLINYAVIYYAFSQENKAPVPDDSDITAEEDGCSACGAISCRCDEIYETAKDREYFQEIGESLDC